MYNASTNAADRSDAASDTAHAHSAPPAQAATILLVEDEAAVRTLAARVLRRTGYTVLEAADGADALRVAGAHAGTIDLLISDLIMPGLDGPTVADELARERPGIRVLLMSGYLEEDLAARGINGPAAFLGKPFLPDELMARVRALLAGPASAGLPAA